jgi:hypothetical protein
MTMVIETDRRATMLGMTVAVILRVRVAMRVAVGVRMSSLHPDQ